MSRVGRNVAWLLASQLATWAASLVTVIVAPDLLGSADFGALSYATGFVMFFTLIAGLGTATLVSRAVARDESIVGPYVWNAFLLKAVLSVALSGVAFGLAYLLGNRGTTLALVAINCGALVIQAFGEVSTGALFGLQRMAGAAVWMVVQVYVATIVGVFVLWLGWGVVAYAAVVVAAGLFPAGATIVMIAPYIRGHRVFDMAIWRVLVVGGIPLMALALFNMIYGTVNIPILHFIAGDDHVGWYSLALRWVGIPVFITTAVTSAFFPEFSKHGQPLTPAFAPLVNRAIGIVLFVTVPAAAGVGLIADDLIRVLYRNDEYDNAIVVMQILAIQIPVTAMDSLLASALVASNRLSRYLYIAAGAALLNPIACVLVIRYAVDRYGNGAIGTAIVMVATELFVAVGAWSLRVPGVMDRGTLLHVARILAAGAVMGATVWMVRDAALAVQIAVGIGSYSIAALVMRAITVEEIRDVGQRVLKRQPDPA